LALNEIVQRWPSAQKADPSGATAYLEQSLGITFD
jgi:hypothetical protein